MDDAAPRDRIDYKTGIIIQEDASYGEHWRFNSTGNISFELDADEWNQIQEEQKERALIERIRIAAIDKASKAKMKAEELELKKQLTVEQKRSIAFNKIRRYKWKGNGLSISPTYVPEKPRLLLREFRDQKSHITKANSIHYITPRDPVQQKLDLINTFGKDEVTTLIYGSRARRESLTEPSEYSSLNSNQSQSIVVKAVACGRRAVKNDATYVYGRPYSKLERRLFRSPLCKPVDGNEFTSDPRRNHEKLT